MGYSHQSAIYTVKLIYSYEKNVLAQDILIQQGEFLYIQQCELQSNIIKLSLKNAPKIFTTKVNIKIKEYQFPVRM